MANRHLSRSIVMQSLFEWDFRAVSISDIPAIVDRNLKEFAPGHPDTPFTKDLSNLVISKLSIVDEIIQKAAPEWPIEKIGIIDRNILRIGLTELVFNNKNIPPKVSINEAIELAKAFGSDTSHRFINGVIGAVYKEMGQPGKDDIKPVSRFENKNKIKQDVIIDPELLPIEKKAGAIVYSEYKDTIYFAFVHDIFGFWTLSKGGIEEGENEQQGAIREIKEEMGIDIVIEQELGRNEYIASHPQKGKIRKQVVYFLGKADFVDLQLEKSGGLDDARWFPIANIPNLNLYENIVPLLAKAIEIITKK